MGASVQEPIPSRFDKTSNAGDVLAGVNLAGKLAIVTGASGGIGMATARALAAAGADVVLGGRTLGALNQARDEIGAASLSQIFAFSLDLMSQKSTDTFANAILDLQRPVHVLINNAAVFGPLIRNEEGVESQLMTNFFGHAILTSRLAPALARAEGARVVCLSSFGHHVSPVVFDDPNFERRPYTIWNSYGQSKTACSLAAVKISSGFARMSVDAFAIHPGAIWTGLGRSMTPDDLEFFTKISGGGVPAEEFKSLETGAATSVWAATAKELEGKGPLYLEDCNVAPLIEKPNYRYGVLRYALDPEGADRAWALAEGMLGRKLPLEA